MDIRTVCKYLIYYSRWELSQNELHRYFALRKAVDSILSYDREFTECELMTLNIKYVGDYVKSIIKIIYHPEFAEDASYPRIDEFVDRDAQLSEYNELVSKVKEIASNINGFVSGSIRRLKKKFHDFDIVTTMPYSDVRETLSKFKEISVIGNGKKRVRISLAYSKGSIEGDIKIVPEGCMGTALLHFTGSSRFNIALRANLKKLGYKLNEYCLIDPNGTELRFNNEEDLLKEISNITNRDYLRYLNPQTRE